MNPMRLAWKRGSVEPVLGTRWWPLPMVLLLLTALWAASVAGIELLDGRLQRLDLDVFLAPVAYSLAIAISYAAAVLNSHGASLSHRLSSIGLLLFSAPLLSQGFRFALDAVALMGLLAVAFVVAQAIGAGPRWQVRPNVRRSGGYSIGSILLITAASALLLAVARTSYIVSEPVVLLVTAGIFLVASIGAFAGCRADRTVSAACGVAAAGFLVVCGLASIFNAAGTAAGICFTVAATILPPWTICYLHCHEPRVRRD